MATLRSPGGCPWDIKQTHQSLRTYLVEETYETLDAIDRGDHQALANELGDVLLQCLFHAQLASETRHFDIVDVLDTLAAKLIRRHPHVFTAAGRPLGPDDRRRAGVSSPKKVLEQWEQIKAREQAGAGEDRRVLAGVPRALPALLRAHKIGSRVSAVGFEWPRAEDILDKADEELRELRAALHESPARAREEMGDLLFTVANLARKLGIEPESALSEANDKFTQRFNAVEAYLQARDQDVHRATLDEMEEAWVAIKQAPSTPVPATPAPPPTSPARRRRRSRA